MRGEILSSVTVLASSAKMNFRFVQFFVCLSDGLYMAMVMAACCLLLFMYYLQFETVCLLLYSACFVKLRLIMCRFSAGRVRAPLKPRGKQITAPKRRDSMFCLRRTDQKIV